LLGRFRGGGDLRAQVGYLSTKPFELGPLVRTVLLAATLATSPICIAAVITPDG
jgi:hypothetical protein